MRRFKKVDAKKFFIEASKAQKIPHFSKLFSHYRFGEKNNRHLKHHSSKRQLRIWVDHLRIIAPFLMLYFFYIIA
jgi:hypothetical protein